MNTKAFTGGKAFALGQFKKQAGRQAQQAGRQIQKQVDQGARQAQRQAQRARSGGRQELWIPGAQRPDWLDGSLPGDRGFDPFALAKPRDYIVFGNDGLDQGDKFEFGELEGAYSSSQGRYQAGSPIAPWNDAYGLDRFRENEIINGRWAMLAVLGDIVAEKVTGIPWNEAGAAENANATYFNVPLPFDVWTTVLPTFVAVGGAESLRTQGDSVEERIYPGGIFDPLNLGSSDDIDRLRLSEVLHCRLAMTAWAGLALQAGWRGTGAFASIDKSALDAAAGYPTA